MLISRRSRTELTEGASRFSIPDLIEGPCSLCLDGGEGLSYYEVQD